MADITKEQVRKAVLNGLEKVYECTRIQGHLSDKQKELVDEIVDLLFTTQEERNLREMKQEIKAYSVAGDLVCPRCEKVCQTTSGLTLHLKKHAKV